MTIITEVQTIGKLVTNYEIDPVTGLKVLWLSTTSYRAVVPTGKRWVLLGGMINRAVSSTYSIHIYDDTPLITARLDNQGAATGITAFPSSTYQTGEAYKLDPGWYIDIAFGTAQDAGSYATCLVLEVKT